MIRSGSRPRQGRAFGPPLRGRAAVLDQADHRSKLAFKASGGGLAIRLAGEEFGNALNPNVGGLRTRRELLEG